MDTEHLIAPTILALLAAAVVVRCLLRGFPPRRAVIPGIFIGTLLVAADLTLAWMGGRSVADVLLLRRADLENLMSFGGYAIAFASSLGVFGART